MSVVRIQLNWIVKAGDMKTPNKFIEALLNQQFETAKQFLLTGSNVNEAYGENGWTALHYAAENRQVETTLWLLENGADPNRKDVTGCSPLHLAIDAETDQLRQEWVRTGLFQPTDAVAAVLLEHGADVNAKTNKGRTPLAVELLRRYGASGEDEE